MKLNLKVVRIETRNLQGIGPVTLVKLKTAHADPKNPSAVEAEVLLPFKGGDIKWHPEERVDGPNNTYRVTIAKESLIDSATVTSESGETFVFEHEKDYVLDVGTK